MQTRNVLALAALLGSSLLATAASAAGEQGLHYPDVVSTARAFEASTDTVLLPTSEGGRITVNHCGGCSAQTFETNSATTYFVGKSQVTLAELKTFLADGRGHSVVVLASLTNSVATRITVSGSLATAVKTR